MKIENKYLELKETKTTSYLKTVSAFANYNDGEIRFGIDDQGNVKPIENMNSFALDIENQINDTFEIRPSFSIVQNSTKTISLFVKKGFLRVTMKDIVEACDISRGGLYLYFESTGQIFLEVI